MKYFFIFSVLLAAPAYSQVQLLTTPPPSPFSFYVGGGFGYFTPGPTYGGNVTDYYNGTNYGLTTGWEAHAKTRFDLASLFLTGEIMYGSLQNNGNLQGRPGTIAINQSVTNVRVGPEFDLGFIPMVHPYIGTNIAVNFFGGEATFEGVDSVPSGTYPMKSATRFGGGVGAGIRFTIGVGVSLDVAIESNWMNLVGKAWEDVGDNNQRSNSYLALNDEKDPQYQSGNDKHFIANPRTIQTFGGNISLLFGF